MSDIARYAIALETRIRWLKWAQTEGRLSHQDFARYEYSLGNGPTYFMNTRFCEMVDEARRDIPDELLFDPSWMVTPSGFLWLEKPFKVPELDQESLPESVRRLAELVELKGEDRGLSISAISWFPIPDHIASRIVRKPGELTYVDQRADTGVSHATYFLVYIDNRIFKGPMRNEGFGMWSFFTLLPGDKVIERIHAFENAKVFDQGVYPTSRATDKLHEIRWIYTAMHLMSQKLAMRVEHTPPRATRKRMEREHIPLTPLLQVVTLRRMEEARQRDPQGAEIGWHWQWRVTGHWRRQWYPSEQTHKLVWIEEYVKGPEDKPFKPPRSVIYKAER